MSFDVKQQSSCSFFGHRKTIITERLKQKLMEIIEDLIVNKNVKIFLFGSRSNFNELCYSVVTGLKEKYEEIKRIAFTCKSETCILENEKQKWEKIYYRLNKNESHMFVVEEEFEHETKYISGKASYIERNQAMINNSCYCIFYYDEQYKPEQRKRNKKAYVFISQKAERHLPLPMQTKKIKI